MKKTLLFIAFAMVMSGCQSSKTADEKEITGTYTGHVAVDDWGSGLESITLHLSDEVDEVDVDTFIVTENKAATDWSDETFPVVETKTERVITDVSFTDEFGNKEEGPSKYVTIWMSTDLGAGSTINYDAHTQLNTYSDPFEMIVEINPNATLTSNGATITALNIDKEMVSYTSDADEFIISEYEALDGVTYEFASYKPEEASKTTVVWLHGVGEGGTENTDPYVTLIANEAVALASDAFQEEIGGANILVPQCPTFWMDQDGSGTLPTTWSGGTQDSSYYTESLNELIEYYVEETDSNKVIIAGASNGGYMTMEMAIEYGDKYDAYVPICEALTDTEITDDEIAKLAKLPMFFIHSNEDPAVDPTITSIATVKRLQDAGATNVEFYNPDQILDTTNRFTSEDGSTHVYNGHFAWIEFFNNTATTSDGKNVWTWMSDTLK